METENGQLQNENWSAKTVKLKMLHENSKNLTARLKQLN